MGGKAAVTDPNWVSKLVVRIGKAAGVVVRTKRDRKTGEPARVVKYASPHDLRRSFGERWASRVMPQVLMQLMRHESIDTTLRYYVGRNAQKTADVLWAAYEREMHDGGAFGGAAPETAFESDPRNDESP